MNAWMTEQEIQEQDNDTAELDFDEHNYTDGAYWEELAQVELEEERAKLEEEARIHDLRRGGWL